MRNPFNTSLSFAAQTGHPDESFDLPSQVDIGPLQNTSPDISDPPSAYRSNAAGYALMPTAPGYSPEYTLAFVDYTGAEPTYNTLNPAPGSADLIEPRDTGGSTGTNDLLQSAGPVTGSDTANWNYDRAVLNRGNPDINGPVVGGPDYGQQLSAAYWSPEQLIFSAKAAEISLLTAV